VVRRFGTAVGVVGLVQAGVEKREEEEEWEEEDRLSV